MWINYFRTWSFSIDWKVIVSELPMYEIWPCTPSESCMMIPGTYAQMHEDYD
jgi:hypothetical protein